MPIIFNPFAPVLAAYRPVTWLTMQTAFAPDTIENCLCEVFKAGDTVPTVTYRLRPAYTQIGSLGQTEYYFEVDIQGFLQRILNPTNARSKTFPDLGTQGIVNCTDAYIEVFMRFSYDVKDGVTGAISTTPTETSPTVRVHSATRQNGEAMDMTQYLPNAAFPYGDWLTKYKTGNQINYIAKADNLFLGSMECPWYEVISLDGNGNNIGTAYLKAGTHKQQVVNMGFPAWGITSGWYLGITPNPDAAFFIVSGGNFFAPSSFVQTIKSYLFGFADECERKLKVHYLNPVGGPQLLKVAFRELVGAKTSDTAIKPLAWRYGGSTPHRTDDSVGSYTVLRLHFCRRQKRSPSLSGFDYIARNLYRGRWPILSCFRLRWRHSRTEQHRNNY